MKVGRGREGKEQWRGVSRVRKPKMVPKTIGLPEIQFHGRRVNWGVVEAPHNPNVLYYGYVRVGGEVLIPHHTIRRVPRGQELDFESHKSPGRLDEKTIKEIRNNIFGRTGCHALFLKESRGGEFEKFE